MMLHKLVKITAFLIPVIAFIWIDQMTEPAKEATMAVFIIAASAMAIKFWQKKQSVETTSQPAAVRTEALSSFMAGQVFLLTLILACYTYPLGGYLARPLLIEHSQENAEAVLVLASGATETGDAQFSGLQRVGYGAKLLKEGRAPHLFISTGYSKRTGHAEFGWVSSYTRMLELDPASYTILVSPQITTTFTEAAYARKVLSEKRINRILLVTSGAHIYRSCLTFRKAGFNVLPAPAHTRDNVFYSSENYLTLMRAALHEWLGLIYYRLCQRI